MKKSVLAGLVIALLIILYFSRASFREYFFQPRPSAIDSNITNLTDFGVLAENLVVPWEIAFLPNDDILVTERPGNIRRVGKNGGVTEVQGVKHIGEGGLLGMALHPDFESNNYIYLYLTTTNGSATINRVERYKLNDDVLSDQKIILDKIPGAAVHDGGRIEFGPDRLLYITTGDAGREELAQDTNSLAGKILRIKDDGSIPDDNPFGNPIYSYGHRNPQGLAWDDQGRLWSTEHGRSGIQSGYDELNIIEKGVNYGWPEIQGNEQRSGMKTPILHSGSNQTWAPGDLDFFKGHLFFAGLRGESLYQVDIQTSEFKLLRHFTEQFGRLRAVRIQGDYIYITTSNRDGRGDVKTNDDKLIRIKLERFLQ